MSVIGSSVTPPSPSKRIAALDWTRIEHELEESGWALAGGILSERECRELVEGYEHPGRYRSHIKMERHNFGLGEYKYFDYPLPDIVQTLRAETYPLLTPIANRWSEALGSDVRYPHRLDEMLKACHAAGQRRATPLILKYGPNDYNRLHQDVYGEFHFPLQLAVLLDRPGKDFTGGEFVITEQRPRTQSRAHVVPISRGEGVIFAVSERPARGSRGYYRIKLRHGVSTLRSGSRHTLGIIFHDAK